MQKNIYVITNHKQKINCIVQLTGYLIQGDQWELVN